MNLRPLLLVLVMGAVSAAETLITDVCVYGASAAGVTAAVQVAREGQQVVLLEPGTFAGGISVDGLGGTDIDNHGDFKNSAAVGGLASEFYRRIGKAYGKDGFGLRFEPHVAQGVVDALLAEHGVKPRFHERLVLGAAGVEKTGTRISAIHLESGLTVQAKVFIDATLEGDLLFSAGVSTVIGREANALYHETKNGIRGSNTYRQFEVKVDPFRIPGDPTSGLIPTVQGEPFGTPGEGDHHLQGYCFRLCFTKDPANRVPFTKPEGYEPGQYEIYLRYLKAGGKLFSPSANLPTGKTDLGSWHDLSLNLYSMNDAYPGGDYATRVRVLREHRVFTQGLCYFLANDAAVPEAVRKAWSVWGTCKDEFADNDGWPRLFYVRDARRMVSDYVITEHHTRKTNQTPVEDPIAVAFWPPDTHHVRRIAKDGFCYNEGFVFGGDDWAPFGISYRALVPKANECTNLLAGLCLSSSHVVYGVIRLE
ncbi:MAG TPA: FAD-dependent oxidoreductase [Planctomycetota bacterium]|nr:FAD-dependent oxidoreductase [Planctomycetota bacterium]